MSLTELVAKNLQAARARRKITQSALARKAKVSVSYVSMLERGQRTPPLETLEALAKALGVPPLALLQASAGKKKR
jgi:transcriptional regulator with XRE-family HTH domain